MKTLIIVRAAPGGILPSLIMFLDDSLQGAIQRYEEPSALKHAVRVVDCGFVSFGCLYDMNIFTA
jgi:hypothetical protein